MTNTTTASLDLDKLEALARAATPGPWDLEDGEVGHDVAPFVFVHKPDADGTPDDGMRIKVEKHHMFPARKPVVGGPAWNALAECALLNAEFIAAANPATILALIDLARRTQTSGSAAGAGSEQLRAVQVFTCIGKGGEYELVGYSNGAGPKRGESIVVYCRAEDPSILYHRGAADFRERMQWQGTRAAPSSSASEQDERALFEAEYPEAKQYRHASCISYTSLAWAEEFADWRARQPTGNPDQLLREVCDAAETVIAGGVALLGPAIDKARVYLSSRTTSEVSRAAHQAATNPPAIAQRASSAPAADEFARGVIAALGVLATGHGYKHGSACHDEIVRSVGEDVIYAAAEDDDYEWAGLDLKKKRVNALASSQQAAPEAPASALDPNQVQTIAERIRNTPGLPATTPASAQPVAAEPAGWREWMQEAIRLFGSARIAMNWPVVTSHLLDLEKAGERLLAAPAAPVAQATTASAGEVTDTARLDALEELVKGDGYLYLHNNKARHDLLGLHIGFEGGLRAALDGLMERSAAATSASSAEDAQKGGAA